MRITYGFVLVLSIGIIGALVSVVMIAGASSGQQAWGDLDCDGTEGTRDNQALLRNVLEQPALSQTQPCPLIGTPVTVDGNYGMWGDLDCDGTEGTRDNQALLRYVLEQPPLSQEVGCPGIGQTVDVGGGGGTPPPTSLPTNSPSPTATQPPVTSTPTSAGTQPPAPTPTSTVAAATQTPTSPPVTPTPTPQPTSQTFGDGTWIVGLDIQPGLWRNDDSSNFCYWARLSGLGGELDDIISNDFSGVIQTVEIKPSDIAFEANRCGTWSQNLQPPSSGPNQPFGDGTWLVGEEVAPGIWRNSDSSNSCYWERRSGLGGTFGEIITNEFDDSIQTVEIMPSDVAFHASRCGTWSRNLQAPSSGPNQPFGPGVWLVGEEVSPGIWRNSDSSESCYWERRSGLSGTFGEIIANGFSTAIQTVAISASDVAFYSHRCGTWTKIG